MVLAGGPLSDSLATRSDPVALTAAIVLWAGWGVVATALLVPSTVSLTVARSLVPAGTVSVIIAIVGAADAARLSGVSMAGALAACVVSCSVVASGEFGQAFVQASAYGDERRFVLRPPVSLMIPAVVSWFVVCAALIIGPLALAARAWLLGVPLAAFACVGSWLLATRLHRLSRRWLVLVPAGVVIHDRSVLAETVMIPVRTLSGARLAFADTEAADLTGPAAGHAVELSFAEVQTVVVAPTREHPRGRALHVRSVLVAPSRPGRFLSAAAASGLHVG